MAQVENITARNAKGFGHSKKHLIRIDMTPMVDLGFLLITFFIFTTTLSNPSITDLNMPIDGDKSNLPESLALSVLLGKESQVYYYKGNLQNAIANDEVFKTNFSTLNGIGWVIRNRQKELETSGTFEGGKRGLMLLIKPTAGSSYKNVIDALDEVLINDVKKYAIIEPSVEEKNYLETKFKSGQ